MRDAREYRKAGAQTASGHVFADDGTVDEAEFTARITEHCHRSPRARRLDHVANARIALDSRNLARRADAFNARDDLA